MHCSHLLIAFQEIQNFSNRSKFICSEDSALLSPAPQRLLPPFPPAQPRVTDTCRVRQEAEGTEHRDSTWLQGSVRAAARISTGHDPGQTTRGRERLGTSCGQPSLLLQLDLLGKRDIQLCRHPRACSSHILPA